MENVVIPSMLGQCQNVIGGDENIRLCNNNRCYDGTFFLPFCQLKTSFLPLCAFVNQHFLCNSYLTVHDLSWTIDLFVITSNMLDS